jgi:hypothetical protein
MQPVLAASPHFAGAPDLAPIAACWRQAKLATICLFDIITPQSIKLQERTSWLTT